MKVLIPVKSILQNGKAIINPFDDIALECALQNKFNVHCLNIGKDPTILKNCLAKGVQNVTLLKTDRTITLESKNSNMSKFLEPLPVAKIIHKFAVANKFDMVMLGKQSTDTEFHCVGPMVASLWGTSQATNISQLNVLDKEADRYKLKITREIDTGQESLNLMTPTVLTADLRLAKPRYIPLSKLIKFKRTAIPTIPLEDFAEGIDLEPKLKVVDISEHNRIRKHVELENVDQLVKILKEYQEAN